MCISQFLVEEETLSPIYPTQWNVFLADSTEYFNNTVALQPATEGEKHRPVSESEYLVLDVQEAA